MLTTGEAQINIKGAYAEAYSLSPSSLITMFEIDVGGLGFNQGIISSADVQNEYQTIFRFHNSIKLSSNSIVWRGKEYVAAPIEADGFEITSKGTLPTPKLRMTVSDDGIPYLTIFKNRILELGDIVGAKVTRIRTFYKYLDVENFKDGKYPDGFYPSNTELPRDIFYIDRKSIENKNRIEYELATFFDIENVKLPGRLVISNSCGAKYRGHGCLYEYDVRRIPAEHGDIGYSTLPTYAPPVANDKNEKFSDLLSGIPLIDVGEYQPGTYQSGQSVYINRNNLNYYFICKGKDVETPPPNLRYWIPDSCSKQVAGCELRYGIGGSASGNVTPGHLMGNMFISVNKFK